MAFDIDDLQGDIAQLQHDGAGFGTGRLVAENLILTAAHTLWNVEKGAGPVIDGWQVRLARDRDGEAWPFRHGNKVVWHDEDFDPQREAGLDLALIELVDPQGGPLRPKLRLRIATVSRSNPHNVEARGYPRASKQADGPRELTPAFGRLTAGGQDRPLRFGVDSCDLPNEPHANWPGMSGSAVLLRDGHDENEIWVYGVVRAVPRNFNGQLTVARLADAWRDATFRDLLTAAGAPEKDAEDPSPDAISDANAAITQLRNLIHTIPAAADAVSRSKEAIENTAHQIEDLELFKTIHDALHTTEVDCLRPLRVLKPEDNFAPYIRAGRRAFAGERRAILEVIDGREMSLLLHDELVEGLESTAQVFHAAVDFPTEDALAQVLGELDRLLALVSPRLDDAISMTASQVKLDHIITLMTTVQGCLPATAKPPIKGSVEEFIRGIDALREVNSELRRRVAEHGRLQRLDCTLRQMRDEKPTSRGLTKAWERVKGVRSKLTSPFSAELDDADADLKAFESDIEAAVARGDENAALHNLAAYLDAVSSVFRKVDSCLKEFTLGLSALSPALRAVLSETENGGGQWPTHQ